MRCDINISEIFKRRGGNPHIEGLGLHYAEQMKRILANAEKLSVTGASVGCALCAGKNSVSKTYILKPGITLLEPMKPFAVHEIAKLRPSNEDTYLRL